MLPRSAVAGLLALWASTACANDSTAELGVGGLTFVQTEAIEMRSEDLFISLGEVRVTYAFVNVSGEDRRTLVAFPLPDVKGSLSEGVAIPTEDPVNFVGFSTTVDGQPVTAAVEQKVYALGLDRTDLLKSLGVPLAPTLAATRTALDALPERWDELVRLGLVFIEEYDDTGAGMRKHATPVWLLRTTFYWEQLFPAGKTVTVQHRYKPSVGTTAGVSFGSPESRKEPWFAAYQRKFCLDRAFLDAVDKARKASKGGYAPFYENRIDYILKTGGNWAGPIASFHAVIDKGDPKNLVSFCGEGVKKIGPTRFEISKRDFVPDKDLAVLILSPIPAP